MTFRGRNITNIKKMSVNQKANNLLNSIHWKILKTKIKKNIFKNNLSLTMIINNNNYYKKPKKKRKWFKIYKIPLMLIINIFILKMMKMKIILVFNTNNLIYNKNNNRMKLCKKISKIMK